MSVLRLTPLNPPLAPYKDTPLKKHMLSLARFISKTTDLIAKDQTCYPQAHRDIFHQAISIASYRHSLN